MNMRSFSYYINWILLGILIGFGILIYQGKIHISFYEIDSDHHNMLQTTTYSDAVALAAPSVVYIQARSHVIAQAADGSSLIERFFGVQSPHRPRRETIASSGSGVILDDEGYILTNYHVIAGSDEVVVGLNDGRAIKARLVGRDVETDLAVLKIDAENIPQLKIADGMQTRIGDIVLAIGYPFTIGQTVTQGIISATGRSRVSSNTYENFIQTDAAINPGNSGGALVNTRGEIVGINSLIYTKTGGFQGIGFAIPIDIALKVLKQIKKHGYVVRGWLGVEGQEVTPDILKRLDLMASKGILITAVDAGGPAEKAGLQPGDIITQINKVDISTVPDIMSLVADGRPGEVFEILGYRERQSFSTNVVLGERPMVSQ